mgnify:CR=1 FL=1
MEKFPLTADDHALIKAASDKVKQPVIHFSGIHRPAPVGSALRLDNGEILASINLKADVASLSVCAEPMVIGEARQRTDRKIDTIVAVYYQEGREPKVIPPCGRCRELMTDFMQGMVIMREPGKEELFKVRARDLLPFKYADYWNEKVLL